MAISLRKARLLTSSNAFEPFQVYRLRPSRLVATILVMAPLAAVVALLSVATLSALAKSLTMAWCGLMTALTWQRHWPGAPQSPAAIALAADGWCEIECNNGERLIGPMNDALILPSIIILALRRGWQCRAVVIPVDALGAERHRQLRAWTQQARRVNEHRECR